MTVAPEFSRDPFATHSAQFPLSRGVTASAANEQPSPVGARPWGLRRMACPTASVSADRVEATYDPRRQLHVDRQGRPVVTMGDPTAVTTGSTDGSEGDPSEDYHND